MNNKLTNHKLLISVLCLLLLVLLVIWTYYEVKETSKVIRKKRDNGIFEDETDYTNIEQIIQGKIDQCKLDPICCKNMQILYSEFTKLTEINQVERIEPFVCFDKNEYIVNLNNWERKPPNKEKPPSITNKFLKDKQTINQYYTPIVQNFQAPVNYYFWPQWQSNLPEDTAPIISETSSPETEANFYRSVGDLNLNYKCMNSNKSCDGIRDCLDGLDEMKCSCKSRIDESRYCDGFFDCPDGDDEIGCFGCNNLSFSCDDWRSHIKRTGKLHSNSDCVLRNHRCDGTVNCLKTGKDEKECILLSDTISKHDFHTVSMSIGFLHANYKGKWYPVCFSGQHTEWEKSAALEVCENEIGTQTKAPILHNIKPQNDSYSGVYFISNYRTNTLHLSRICSSGSITFVICPIINCGTRMYNKPLTQNRDDVDDLDDDVFEFFEKKITPKRDLNNNYERIVGGVASHPAAWPWVVTIYRNGLFHCGGIIINELWIMSAAHCVEKYWLHYFEIQAGVLRRFSYSPQEQNRIVIDIVEHKKYDRNSMHNDLSLLKIETPLQFNRWVRPICLPAPGMDPLSGTKCTAVGWGATQERGLDPDHMRDVDLPILEKCKHRIDLDGNELCAGYQEGGKDSCQGDSGGPLLCKMPIFSTQWYVAGIVSHGEGCARPNEPGVYTRVSLYSTWINNIINTKLRQNSTKPLRLCPGFYCDDNNRCISRRKRCDRIIDCLDGSDEFDCDDDHKLKLLKKHSVINHEEFAKRVLPQLIDTTTIQYDNDDSLNASTVAITVEDISLNFKHEQTFIADSTLNQPNEYFFCKIIEQLVPYGSKCDRKIDCEDATDEMFCTCRNYLENSYKKALCDGIVDCKDLTDESYQDCFKCNKDEFKCGIDKKCIPLTQRCNHIRDCDSQEDEWNCFALSDHNQIEIDFDSKPMLKKFGVLVHNIKGLWYPICIVDNKTKDNALLADDICSYLGFHGYAFFNNQKMVYLPLNETGRSTSLNHSFDVIKECNVLQVQCSSKSYFINKELNSDFHFHDFIDDPIKEIYIYPWNVAVYIEGIYTCTGGLIDSYWVLTQASCFENKPITDNYISIISGMGKGHLNVEGPYEQISRINEIIQIQYSDIILLKLDKEINTTRYSKPIQLAKKNELMSDIPLCLAIGLGQEDIMTAVPLKMLKSKTCNYNKFCFRRLNQQNENCNNTIKSLPWKGMIACLSDYGWVPTSVFIEKSGECGFVNISRFTNIHLYTSSINNILAKDSHAISAPECDGLRCKIGKCIDWSQVCNNIQDCLKNEDESDKACIEKKTACAKNQTGACGCKISEIPCKNKKCVSKQTFLNYENDCGDWTDEPEEQTCASYLNLTEPDLICNGIRNCFDKSDEDPNKCTCKSTDFLCNSKHYKTVLCIPMDFVCDGESDCPNNEDELKCFQLNPNEIKTSNIGILHQRTMGVWHPLCLNSSEVITRDELIKTCKIIGKQSIDPKVQFIEEYIDSPIIDQFTRVKLNNVTQIIMRKSKNPMYYLDTKKIPCIKLKLYCI